MKKLQLHYTNLLQGNFEILDLNVLLVFQVNCPGCFSYALPFFNTLYREFSSKGISFLALSTAFEDFDKNTLANTKALIEHGIIIGETKKMMLQQGYDDGLPYTLDFPIAMDIIEEKLSELDSAVDKICTINPDYHIWSDFEKKELQKRVKYYLKSLDKTALTFTLNQLRGTPSFILFNREYDVLNEWLGHVHYEQISSKITHFM